MDESEDSFVLGDGRKNVIAKSNFLQNTDSQMRMCAFLQLWEGGHSYLLPIKYESNDTPQPTSHGATIRAEPLKPLYLQLKFLTPW